MREMSLVFAGGGCRTFWALGAQTALADLATPVELAGVSAGAAMALAVAAGLERALVDVFCARTAVNRRNVYPERLFLGRPVFPQEAMYRGTMLELLDATSVERLARGPRVRILQAYVEPGRPVVPTVARAWWAYAARRRRGVLHGPELPHPGIAAEVDTPVRALGPAARAGAVLVLLNRPCTPQALADNVHYLAPSREVPIHKWDYTSPDRVRQAFDLGCRDGEAARPAVEHFLARQPSSN